MKGMLQTGSRRCIVYLSTKEECIEFNNAWKLLGIKSASYAQLKSMDKDGFVLDVRNKKRKEIHSYKFKKQLKDATESRKILMELHERASTVIWPSGIMPIIVLIFYISALVAIIPYQDLMNITVLENLKIYALQYIYGTSTTASIVLLTTVIAHTLEGAYAFYLCRQHIKLSKKNSISWASLTLILGYPVLSDLIFLSKVATTKKNN
jgi:hypothetical protein